MILRVILGLLIVIPLAAYVFRAVFIVGMVFSIPENRSKILEALGDHFYRVYLFYRDVLPASLASSWFPGMMMMKDEM
jgi:hypothetical protein